MPPGGYPDGKQGDVLTVEFTVLGIPCLGLNGGSTFQHSEAFSFQIITEDQAETVVTGMLSLIMVAKKAIADGAKTRILRKKNDLAPVQKILGHRDISSTMRYAHVGMEDIADTLSHNSPENAEKMVEEARKYPIKSSANW